MVVTSTLMVQVVLAGMVKLVITKEVSFAAGVNDPVHPVPVILAFGVLYTFIWDGAVGKVSVRLTPLTAVPLVFWIAMERVENPVVEMEVGEKDLVIVKGDEMTA